MKLNSDKAVWLAVAGVLAIVFGVSAALRPPGLPMKRQLRQTWLTCNSVKYARNWYREGAVALRFRLVNYPRSVETPELKDRDVYPSYPPGSIVPVWLAAKLSGAEPSIKMVVAINLGLHFLIALGLAGIALNLLSGLAPRSRLAGGLGAGLFYVCAGGPFHLHWAAYFADTAVLFPVVLLLWLESFRARDPVRHGWVRLAIPVVVFCGSLTDPLMVVLAAVLSAWRLIVADKECRGKEFYRVLRELAFPVVLAVGLFALQLAAGGLLDDLGGKFFKRGFVDVGPEKAKEAHSTRLFFSYFRRSDLWLLLIPCAAGLVFRAADRALAGRKTRRQNALIVVLFAACLVELLGFWNHSYSHPFSVLKLYVPAALMLGVTIAGWAEDARLWKIKLGALGLFFLAMIPGLWREEIRLARGAPPYPFPTVVRHIAQTASYQDVYLSPVISIRKIPPQLLSVTMKIVWGVKNSDQVEAVLAGVHDQPCTLHFLVLDTAEMAALFSSVPSRKAVHDEITEYAVDARHFSAIATNMAALFTEQDSLYRKRHAVNRKMKRTDYLVPWPK